MHSGTSFPPVPACCSEPTNQQGDKQGVGIFACIGKLYGPKAEVCPTDNFLEWKVTYAQSVKMSDSY